MALTDTEDFFRLSVIAMPKRRSIFDFREQRAKQPCLHGYLATATKIRCSAVCSGVSDCFSHLPSNKQEKESRRVKCRKKVY